MIGKKSKQDLRTGKRYPSFEHDSIMPFGKHKGKQLKDVPAYYLAWLWEQKVNHQELANYIYNNIHAINMELPPDKHILR